MSGRRATDHGAAVEAEVDEITTGPVDLPTETRFLIHEMKFRNGQKAMADIRGDIGRLREDVAAMDEKMRPKPTNWFTVATFAAGTLITILGAWWTLSTMFNDRPTRGELKDATENQRKAIEEQAADMREVRDKQTEHRVILETVREEVRDTARKMDVLIQDKNHSPRGR